MELNNILENLQQIPAIRKAGLYSEYKPETTHKDVIYLATDKKAIYFNDTEFGLSEDSEVIGFMNNRIDAKADAINTYSKADTYNKTEINAMMANKGDSDDIPTNVSQLNNDANYQTAEDVDNRFEQLVGAAPADLDTLEEIAEKLQDGDDIHTALVQSISEKLPKTEYTAADVLDKIKTVDGENSGLDADLLDGKQLGIKNNTIPYYINFPKYTELVNLGYNTEENKTNTEEYLKGLCKWAIDNFSGNGYIILQGNLNPNANGWAVIQLYSSDGKDNTTGLPKYCSGQFNHLNGTTHKFGTDNYSWKYGVVALLSDNVASAYKLAIKQLTNEDLNVIAYYSQVYTDFYAPYDNTCTNTPLDTGKPFMLKNISIGGSIKIQMLMDYLGNIYTRKYTSPNWRRLVYEDEFSWYNSSEVVETNIPTMTKGDSRYIKLHYFESNIIGCMNSGKNFTITINFKNISNSQVFDFRVNGKNNHSPAVNTLINMSSDGAIESMYLVIIKCGISDLPEEIELYISITRLQ